MLPNTNEVISYGELSRDSDKFANALLALGVKKGDRVSIYLPLCPEWTVCYLAILKAGAILESMNDMLKSRSSGMSCPTPV